MQEAAITTSRSIIMHTSLAYLSPEIRTFDSILHDSLVGKLSVVSERLRFPTEILLLIRHQLLSALTSQLFDRSTQALAHYESSLRKLLCQECLSYFQDVYGPDIWGWEQFTGACTCRVAKEKADGGQAGYQEIIGYCNLWSQEQPFPNCSTWLESYLSFELSRRADFRDSFHSIWDVVGVVLEDHGCRLSDNAKQPNNHRHFRPFRHIKIAVDIPTAVTIVPAQSAALEGDVARSAPIIIRRADRDLGLSLASEQGLEIRRHAGQSCPQPRLRTADLLPPLSSKEFRIAGIVAAFSTIAVAAASLPLTLATIALTVVCYYSTPHALRIL
ncbi:hypothetical protein LshimejAT787_0300070 [Lyophyllum shimeji]|uniref:Uncharacterized protein n=1 Tax=Lyophyllum shimeji TaxID=47721 RepID=A0A9P3PHS5_LYOSH|nr:hypothetical protein LshimejAT787_0300070 [Lyophyllum shimeji]